MTDPLLTHVVENPADNEARLVYADHLSGKGDPRGEFISTQVSLASRISPGRRKQLAAIEAELLAEHEDAFLEPVTKSGLSGILRRGFIETVEGSLDAFVAVGASLKSIEPIDRLHFTDGDDDGVGDLLAGNLLDRIRALRIDGDISDEGAAKLAASEQLASLRILNLRNNQIGDEGLKALVLSPHFQLESLTLNGNAVTSEGVRALAASPATHTLKRLFLSRNELDNEAATSIVGSPHLTDLRELSLSGNEGMGDGAVLAFADEALLSRFRIVELEEIEISRSTRTRIKEIWGKRLQVDPY